MAQLYFDPNEVSTGAGTPTGVTARFNASSGDFAVVDRSGNHVLEFTFPGTTATYGCSIDVADGLADCEVYMLATLGVGGIFGAWPMGIFARGGDTGRYIQGAIAEGSGGYVVIEEQTANIIEFGDSFEFSDQQTIHCLLNVSGGTATFKAWLDGNSEPGSVMATHSVDSNSSAGYTGFAPYGNSGDMTHVDILFIGVGTNGDSAPREASSSVEGSLSKTEANDTLASSGTVSDPTVTGSLSETEQSDTLSASGTHTAPTFSGSVSTTESDDTLAASGTVTSPGVSGTLSETEENDTLAASGTVTSPTVSGTLSETEPPDTLSASGTVNNPSVSGSLAETESDDTLSSSGTVSAPTFTGSLSVTESDDTLFATSSGSKQVSFDPNDESVGSGAPSGLTPRREATDGNFAIVEKNGRNVLEFTPNGTTGDQAISLDSVDGEDEVEVYIAATLGTGGIFGAWPAGCVARIDEGTPDYVTGAIAEESYTVIDESAGTTFSDPDTFTHAAGDTVHMLLKVSGTTAEFYAWQDGDAEPATPIATRTVSNVGSGFAGFNFFGASSDLSHVDILYIGIGTQGLTAPRPTFTGTLSITEADDELEASTVAPLPTGTILGMYRGWGGASEIDAFANNNNLVVHYAHEFGDHSEWSFFNNGTNFDIWSVWVSDGENRRFTYSVPLLTDDSPGTQAERYADLVAGTYDHHFESLGQAIQSYPELQNTIIRLGWEFNGNTFPWAVPPNDSTTLQNYKDGFARIAAILKAEAPNIEIEWCPNIQLDYTQESFDNLYPDDDSNIDYIGLGQYDYYWPGGSPTDAEREDWLVNGETGVNGFQHQVDIATANNKKLCFTEYGLWESSSLSGGGDRPAYIHLVADWMQQHNYSFHVYNNVNADGGHDLDNHPNALDAYIDRFGEGSAVGSLSVSENPDTLSSSGTRTIPDITGTIDHFEQDDTLAASGDVFTDEFSGTLSITESSDTLAAVGTGPEIAEGGFRLPDGTKVSAYTVNNQKVPAYLSTGDKLN